MDFLFCACHSGIRHLSLLPFQKKKWNFHYVNALNTLLLHEFSFRATYIPMASAVICFSVLLCSVALLNPKKRPIAQQIVSKNA